MSPNIFDIHNGLSRCDDAAIIVLPVPFDKTATWIKGSEKGPEAIIRASSQVERYDIETRSEVYKQGIHTAQPVKEETSESMIDTVFTQVSSFLQKGKFVVTIGGEHSVSLGAVKAYGDHVTMLSVLHIDAHADRRDSYEGSRYNHACVAARLKEMTDTIVSVGIRSMDSCELECIAGDAVFYAHEVVRSDKYVEKAAQSLTENVYVTLDLDVFDPSIMPSTGTPEPGGLSWYQVIGLLRAVSEQKTIVGFDITELCPGENKAPDFLAAKLIYKFLSYVFWHNR